MSPLISTHSAPRLPQAPARQATAVFCTTMCWSCCQYVAKSHPIIGIDLVEVAPDYDPSGSTQILAAQILLNFLGFIFQARVGEGPI